MIELIEAPLSPTHPRENLWMSTPFHHERFAGTWVEDIATDISALEAWEHMTEGGVRVE